MNAENPYSSPQSNVSTVSGTTPSKVLSLSGRLNRLRYWVYINGVPILIMLPFALLGVALGAIAPPLAGVAIAIGAIVAVVFAIGFGRRRLNDLDKSGWFMLLMLVPLVNIALGLYLLFAKGSEGDNRFGAPPEENTGVIKALAIIFILLTLGNLVLLPGVISQIEAQQAQMNSDLELLEQYQYE